MNNTIKVDEEALDRLRGALQTAGENFKSNLSKLEFLMDEITSGDIQGEVATDFLNKFRNRESVLKNIEKTINDAENYTGDKLNKFNNLIGNL